MGLPHDAPRRGAPRGRGLRRPPPRGHRRPLRARHRPVRRGGPTARAFSASRSRSRRSWSSPSGAGRSCSMRPRPSPRPSRPGPSSRSGRRPSCRPRPASRRVLPAGPARQAHGRQRPGPGRRRPDDAPPRARARHPRRRPRGRARHLRGRVALRGRLRHRPHGPRALPRGHRAAPPPAGPARHVDLHEVGPAGDARDPERHPDALLRDRPLPRAGARGRRRPRHVRLRDGVADLRAPPRPRRTPPRSIAARVEPPSPARFSPSSRRP